ncbi:MAG: Bifunctional oligoribonuclease and PAP phosphatase NrnA [Firmicutes bacterium ADurb.Bin356]|nr:MAG: Bifunctional oligoribonuclease and PAP phosphatase NrnA [Firmicutes bacterium ADurb.Bin356]
MMIEAAAKMAQWLRLEDGFTLIAHTSPDGDTIGSSLAMFYILTCMGKRVQVVCEHIVPYLYSFLPYAEAFNTPDTAEKSYKNAIAIDCADKNRMGKAVGIYNASMLTGSIDHHKTNTAYGDYVLHDENASATGELVFHLWQHLGVAVEKSKTALDIACSLFTAISTDTGNFSYCNATPGSFRAAAALVEYGIDIAEINRLVYRTLPIGKTRLIGYVLSSMRLYNDARIGAAILLWEDFLRFGAIPEDVEGIIDYIRDVDSIEIAMILRQTQKGDFKVSMRSKRYADVSAIAGRFGGGGHLRAAGCTMQGQPEAILEQLLQVSTDALGQ